jgi:hypothetical protein
VTGGRAVVPREDRDLGRLARAQDLEPQRPRVYGGHRADLDLGRPSVDHAENVPWGSDGARGR